MGVVSAVKELAETLQKDVESSPWIGYPAYTRHTVPCVQFCFGGKVKAPHETGWGGLGVWDADSE